jgi:hypothetical protein
MLRVKYSPMETRLWEMIPDDGRRISTIELIGLVYPAGEEPRYARQSILDCANALIEKSDENEEPLELFRSQAHGSQPIFFWKKPRELRKIQNEISKKESV